MPNRDLQQTMALRRLAQRLTQEQLAFDSGDSEYDEYQTRLDAIQAKEDALTQARLQARQNRPSPPVRA